MAVRGRARGATTALTLALAVTACEFIVDPTLEDYPRITQPSSVNLDGSVKSAYEESAAIMALRIVQAANGSALRSVELPPELVTSLYNALLRVHAFSHPARDSVVDLYRIRAFPRPTVREIAVTADRTLPWMQKLRANQRPTGNEQVDALVSRYDLRTVHHFDWPGENLATVALAGPGPLNTIALAKEFGPIAGVRWSEPNGYVGDGDDIRVEARDGGWRLSYSVGSGDCPAGCIARTSWHFQVDAGGVSYRGRTGDPPPPPRW
jgi:hypothetical protein